MYKRILGVLVLAALVAVGLGYVVMQRGQGTAKVAPPDAGVQIATPAPVDAVPPAPAAQPVPVAAPQPAAMVPPTASTAPIAPVPASADKNVMVAPSAVAPAVVPSEPAAAPENPSTQIAKSPQLFPSAKEAENAMMNYARLPVPLQLEGLKQVLKLNDEQHQKLRTYLLAYDEYQARPVMLNSTGSVGMDAPPVAGMGMAPNARPLQRRIDELKAEQSRLESFQTLRGNFLKSLSKAQKEKMDKLVKPEDF